MTVRSLVDHPKIARAVEDVFWRVAKDFPDLLILRSNCARSVASDGFAGSFEHLLLESAIHDICNKHSWAAEYSPEALYVSDCVAKKVDAQHRESLIPVRLVEPSFSSSAALKMRKKASGYSVTTRRLKARTLVTAETEADLEYFRITADIPNLIGANADFMISIFDERASIVFDLSRLCGSRIIQLRDMSDQEMQRLVEMFGLLVSAGHSFIQGYSM
jgi:hypothetical protein